MLTAGLLLLDGFDGSLDDDDDEDEEIFSLSFGSGGCIGVLLLDESMLSPLTFNRIVYLVVLKTSK